MSAIQELELLDQDWWFNCRIRSDQLLGERFVDAPDAMLKAALAFAERGLPVFPVNYPVENRGSLACSCGKQECPSPAKHPLAKFAPRGVNDATTNSSIIKRRWSSVPNANIGLAAAVPASNGSDAIEKLVVIDIDPRATAGEGNADLDPQHNGDTSLAMLELDNNGPFGPTWRAVTGGGGQHIFFRPHPRFKLKNGTSVLDLSGCDLKCAGGYVVAPPSRHISGKRYAWTIDHHPDRTLLAEFPTWLALELVRHQGSGGKRTPPDEWVRRFRERIKEGGRNSFITSVCGLLLQKDIDPRVIFEIILSVNADRCRPPLDEGEVERIFRSIGELELKRRSREHARTRGLAP